MSIPSIPLDQRGCLSIAEFVQWSGLSRSLVYLEIKASRLATTKVGRGVARLQGSPHMNTAALSGLCQSSEIGAGGAWSTISIGASTFPSTAASRLRHSAATSGVTEYMRALAIMRRYTLIGPVFAMSRS